jgi:hypothetical protein
VTGKCYIDGKEITPENSKYIVVTKGDCLNSNGTWVSDPPTGICFVRDILTRSLGEMILELGDTLPVAVEFRDRVLKGSPTGDRYLSLYYDNMEHTFGAARQNYRLIANFVEVWMSILPFVRAVLEELHESEPRQDAGASARLRFDKRLHERVVKFLDDVGKSTESAEYRAVLADVREELDRYVGMDAAEMLRAIRKSEP